MCNNNIKIKSRADMLTYAKQVQRMVDEQAKKDAERIIARNEKEGDNNYRD